MARDAWPPIENHAIQPTRIIAAGGIPAVTDKGRPIPVAVADCRALVGDRHGRHRCRRRGWFVLREASGALTGPLCGTHLQRLARLGGDVRA